MKKILVTGCAGFIGCYVAERLLDNGIQVIGIDNINDYYDVGLKNHRLSGLKRRKNFIFNHLDIENLKDIEGMFRTHAIDAVINLAARAGVRYSMENPHVYMTTNLNGTLNLLELMKNYGIKKMVLASTSSLYAGQKIPFSEDLAVNTPISPYAASKKAAEVIAYTYHYLYGLDITVVRYFTVYGPAGRPDMSIFRFIKWIDEGVPLELFGDGSQSRDFTYIDDIADGTIKGLKEIGYEIINLGGGKKPATLNYIIAKLEGYLGKKAVISYKPFHKADILETGADIRKANRLLAWSPQTDLDKGLNNTVEWYLENKDWLKEIRI